MTRLAGCKRLAMSGHTDYVNNSKTLFCLLLHADVAFKGDLSGGRWMLCSAELKC